MTKRKNGLPDMRFKVNHSIEAKEYIFWKKYGVLVCAGILGALAGIILTKSIYDATHKPLLNPKGSGSVIVKQVEAYQTPCDFDPITYIRCKGEQLNMPNQDIMKMIRIARCESGFNQYAKNPNSTAKGIFQFIDGTWRANCLKDGNVYSFVDNINCAWKVYQKQNDRPWHSSIKCWNK